MNEAPFENKEHTKGIEFRRGDRDISLYQYPVTSELSLVIT